MSRDFQLQEIDGKKFLTYPVHSIREVDDIILQLLNDAEQEGFLKSSVIRPRKEIAFDTGDLTCLKDLAPQILSPGEFIVVLKDLEDMLSYLEESFIGPEYVNFEDTAVFTDPETKKLYLTVLPLQNPGHDDIGLQDLVMNLIRKYSPEQPDTFYDAAAAKTSAGMTKLSDLQNLIRNLQDEAAKNSAAVEDADDRTLIFHNEAGAGLAAALAAAEAANKSAVQEEAVVKEEPAPEAAAEEEAPAEEPVAEEVAPAEEPVAEEVVAAEEPVAEEVPEEEPAAEEEVPAEEPAAEEEVPAEEPAAEEEVPAQEPVAEEEVPAQEPVAEEEVPAEEPAAEEEVPAQEPAAEEEVPAEEPAAEEEVPAQEPAAEEEAPDEEPAAEEETSVPAAYLFRKKSSELIQIQGNPFVIGKVPLACDYVITDNPALSRIHAMIRYIEEEEAYYIIDCNSTNHIYLNGVRVTGQQIARLADKDRIHLATEEFVFNIQS